MYENTQRLLNRISPYFDVSHVKIERSKTFLGDEIDLVTLSVEPNIAFEASDEHVIFYFFFDHIHFDDLTTELKEGEPDYMQRAEEFVDNLFCLPLLLRTAKKGDRVVRTESFFVHPNGQNESIAGICFYGAGMRNVFKKKSILDETWQYDHKSNTWMKL